MSYILEALKKSERERELGSVPSLARLHEESRPQSRQWLPVALAVTIVLCLALIGWNFRDRLAFLWTPEPPPIAAQRAVPETIATTAANQPAPDVEPAEPVDHEVAIAAPIPAPTRSPSPTVPAAATPLTPPTAAAPTEWDRLDAAFKAQLPALAVNVLSYSETPAKRFVMINQRIMREGQSLRGVEVVGITRDGAVLRYRNTEFVLRP